MGARWDGDGLNDEISHKTGLSCKDASLTKQSDREAADINNILRRYEKSGVLPEMISAEPQWGDFSDVPTYQQALNVVQKAETQFGLLDAEVRAKFANDPKAFLAFAVNPNNAAEMVKLGLAKEIPMHMEGGVLVPDKKPVKGDSGAPVDVKPGA